MEASTETGGLSKKQQKKLAQKKAKEERKAKRAAELKAQEEARLAAEAEAAANDDSFGTLELIQSKGEQGTPKKLTALQDITAAQDGETVAVRARIQTSRAKGNLVFLVLRQGLHTLQVVVAKSENVSKFFVKFAAGINEESIVDVEGKVGKVEEPIEAASQKDVEIAVHRLYVVSAAPSILPIRPFDCSVSATQKEEEQFVTVSQKMRLDNRVLDLRTQANHAIFRMQAMLGLLFREYLTKQGFVEIHSPKLIGAASEGGANVFGLKYFGRDAFLAQSPQFYKQMSICAGFDKVFEIGPVFRAENSHTHRHLCEFVGLDLEMAFQEHYHEVLDVFDGLFTYIFDGFNERCKLEMEAIRRQYPFEDLKYKSPQLRLTFKEGIDMLREAGEEIGYHDDLPTVLEKKLGGLVREKYGVDFYMLDKFPLNIRPFYTMPSPEDPELSNSYDFMLRGEEILSGAQRIHDYNMLEANVKKHGVDVTKVQHYLDAFKYGAPPHGGGGIGCERVVMLFLGLNNIRKSSLFPRDPNRLAP